MIVSSTTQPIIETLVNLLSPRLGIIVDTNMEVQGVAIAGEAVQLVNSMIRTRKGPLEPALITGATIPIVRCLQTTDDMDVVQVSETRYVLVSKLTDQHGMLHLTQIIRKDCEKLLQWLAHRPVAAKIADVKGLVQMVEQAWTKSSPF